MYIHKDSCFSVLCSTGVFAFSYITKKTFLIHLLCGFCVIIIIFIMADKLLLFGDGYERFYT